MKKVLVAGLGNVLLGDDAVGPYVTHLLAAHYKFGRDVELADLGTPAFDLIHYLCGRDAVIFVDSVKSKACPGSIQIFRTKDILSGYSALRTDAHSPALVRTLLSTELLGTTPPHVVEVGVVGESYTPHCSLSPAVARSLGHAADEVLRQLDRLGANYQCREYPLNCIVWWERLQEYTSETPESSRRNAPNARPVRHYRRLHLR